MEKDEDFYTFDAMSNGSNGEKVGRKIREVKDLSKHKRGVRFG